MLKIKENPGSMPIQQMRVYFERFINDTAAFKNTTPIGIVEVNGKFSHYMDSNTDTLWLGFAIGMRAAERLAKAVAQCKQAEVASG